MYKEVSFRFNLKIISILLIALLIVSMFPTYIFAEGQTINVDLSKYTHVYYVDGTSGNDTTGNGSESNPYLTFNKAYDLIADKTSAIFIKNTVTETAITNINVYKTLDIIGNYSKYKSTITGVGMRFTNITGNIYNVALISNNSGQWSEMFYNNNRYPTINFYNCIFSDNGTDFSNVVGSYNYYNCLILRIATMYYSTVNFTNCAFTQATLPSNTYSAVITQNTCLMGVTVDSDYKITSSGWKNTGTGTNLDGTKANIGVYGGLNAWEDNTLDIPSFTNCSANSNSIILNWDSVPNVTGYKILVNNTQEISTENVNTYTVKNLTPNTSYSFKICGTNNDIFSKWSTIITLYTTAIEPQKVIVDNASDKEVKVSVNGSINPIGTQYNFGAFQNSVLVKETGFTTNNTASIEGLTPNQTYDIKVATKSTNGVTTSFRTLGTITVPDNKSTNGDLDVNVIVDPTVTLTINTNSVNFGNVSPLTESYELPNVLVVGIQSNSEYSLSAKVNDDFIGSKGFKMPSSLLSIKEHNNNYVSFQNGVKTDLVANQAPTSGTNYNIDLKLKTDYTIKPDTYSNIINIAVNQL